MLIHVKHSHLAREATLSNLAVKPDLKSQKKKKWISLLQPCTMLGQCWEYSECENRQSLVLTGFSVHLR